MKGESVVQRRTQWAIENVKVKSRQRKKVTMKVKVKG